MYFTSAVSTESDSKLCLGVSMSETLSTEDRNFVIVPSQEHLLQEVNSLRLAGWECSHGCCEKGDVRFSLIPYSPEFHLDYAAALMLSGLQVHMDCVKLMTLSQFIFVLHRFRYTKE